MMNATLLSICIPTFNRVSYLKELVPALLQEIENATARTQQNIELLISNNASTDTTHDYLQSVSSPFLCYRKNDRNIGAELNYLECIKHARGSYIWLFGDDDLVEKDALEGLIRMLVSQRPELVIFDHASSEPRIYPTYKSCLASEMLTSPTFSISHTLITANVFRKDIFDVAYAHRNLWSSYAQMYGLMRNSKTYNKIVVMGNMMRTHPQRAPFSKWPFALCVKQGCYLFCLAKWTGVSPLYWQAVRACMNLPLELLSRFVHRFFPSLLRRA